MKFVMTVSKRKGTGIAMIDAELPARLERATRELKTLSLVATTLAYIMVQLLDKTSPCSAAKWCQQPISGRLRLCSSKMRSKARSLRWHTATHTWYH